MSERDEWLRQELAQQAAREQAEIDRRLNPATRGQIIAERHAREPRRVTLQEVLEPLQEVMRDIERRMASVACGGDRERVGECHAWVEARCRERESNNCPKRVLEFEAKLDRRGQREPHEVYAAMGIPGAIADLVAYGSLEQREALTTAETWWRTKPRPRVLVLHGYSQIGKSVAAAKLVADWSGRFVHLPTEFKNNLRDGQFKHRLLTPGLLAMDDLGLEQLDGFDEFKAAFDGVFCARVDAGNFTVITTNSASQIRARYGDRVAERINRFGMAQAIGEAS